MLHLKHGMLAVHVS